MKRILHKIRDFLDVLQFFIKKFLVVVLPIGDDRTAALKARDEFARRDFSDHLMLIRAFYAYTAQYNRQYNFCRANFLSPQTMKMIYGIRWVILSI